MGSSSYNKHVLWSPLSDSKHAPKQALKHTINANTYATKIDTRKDLAPLHLEWGSAPPTSPSKFEFQEAQHSSLAPLD